MNAPHPLDFDFPAFPMPAKVNTAIARLNPSVLRECELTRKRMDATITPAERLELAELLETLAAEDAERERRELHPDRKINFKE